MSLRSSPGELLQRLPGDGAIEPSVRAGASAVRSMLRKASRERVDDGVPYATLHAEGLLSPCDSVEAFFTEQGPRCWRVSDANNRFPVCDGWIYRWASKLVPRRYCSWQSWLIVEVMYEGSVQTRILASCRSHKDARNIAVKRVETWPLHSSPLRSFILVRLASV